MEGNDDCGAMSAWYILSALGFYPLDPTSGEYVIGSPCIKSATVNIGSPFRPVAFRITVHGQPTANRPSKIRSVRLNGRELREMRFSHAEIVHGGLLEFKVDAE